MVGCARTTDVCALVVLLASCGLAEPAARFHHIHLNSTDPKAALEFYNSKFDMHAGRTALLFNKVAAAPASDIASAIWHFGWGAEDMKAAYRKQIESGTKFHTPLTDISKLANVPGFYYAYVDGPDHALIELNTANHHRLGHLHLLSADPISAGEWYVQHLGAVRRGTGVPSREPRFYEGFQVGPSMSLSMGEINVIIYPWVGKAPIVSTKGRVVDHIGFAVDDLNARLKTMRGAGVKVLERTGNTAFIEGPDHIAIELFQETPAVAEFIHGDECLFCHRKDIGADWQNNRHGTTMRQREDAPDIEKRLKVPDEATHFLGSGEHVRYLKKTGYGKVAMLSEGKWDEHKFADRCAGCHATAVDSKTRTFDEIGLDCYTCHGAATLEHTNNIALMWLSKKRRTDAQAVTAICGQCHLRGGRSLATGLPYANNFVAGENLFRDFAVDWLNAGDGHAWRSARDVMLGGSDVSCLSCHRVHGRSTAKHRLAAASEICMDCHVEGRPRKVVKRDIVRSEVCEY